MFAELAPAGMVTLVPMETKSLPDVAEPLMVKLTVSAFVVEPTRETVSNPVPTPVSVAVPSAIVMLTTGLSSSNKFTVAELGEPML